MRFPTILLLTISLVFTFTINAQLCNLQDASGCDCPDGSNSCLLLPDITISEALLEDVNNLYEVPGLLEISVSTPNIGYGPLRVIPKNLIVCGTDTIANTQGISFQCPNGEEPKQLIVQRVYKKDGSTMTYEEYDAGAMTYHPQHSHMHVDDWGLYTIRKKIPGLPPESWPMLGDGVKLGFCLMDFGSCQQYVGYCKDENDLTITSQLPNHGLGGGNYSCGLTNQGISVGYTDIYYHNVPGMEILIPPGTCNGEYKIVVQIDPNNHFLESNENNNTVIGTLYLTEQSEKQEEALSLEVSKDLCNGETATLSANYGDSFLWSTGETAQSITIETAGNYSCRIETDCGYIFSDTITFNYDTIPTPAIPDTLNLCNLTGNTAFISSEDGMLSCFVDSLGNELLAEDDTLFLNTIPDSLSAIYIKQGVELPGDTFSVGMVNNTGGESNSPTNNGELHFDVHTPFTLVSVKTYADDPGDRIFQLYDRNYNLIHETTKFVNSGEQVVELNFDVGLGIDYRLKTRTHGGFYRNSTNVNYPYEVPGIVSITGNNYGAVFYYYFYDWKIKLPDRSCESDLKRVEIINGAAQQAQILNLPSTIYKNSNVVLNATPVGGIFSNNVSNGNVLDVSSMPTGLNFVTYLVIPNNQNCASSVTKPIMVLERNDNYGSNTGNTLDP